MPAVRKKSTSVNRRYWSGRVTRESHALALDSGVFTWHDPTRIARSLKRSAERSRERKAAPFRSAMSMLVFYVNRAGRSLGQRQRRVLEAAKDELRRLYGRPASKAQKRTTRPRASRTRARAT